jgi:hypothetical protein
VGWKNTGKTPAINLQAPRPKGVSGNRKGRPKGALGLSTRVRQLLEGQENLPDAIAKTIRAAVGADRQALDATIIVGFPTG